MQFRNTFFLTTGFLSGAYPALAYWLDLD